MIGPGSIVRRMGGTAQYRVDAVFPHMSVGAHNSTTWARMRKIGEAWVKTVTVPVSELTEVDRSSPPDIEDWPK